MSRNEKVVKIQDGVGSDILVLFEPPLDLGTGVYSTAWAGAIAWPDLISLIRVAEQDGYIRKLIYNDERETTSILRFESLLNIAT